MLPLNLSQIEYSPTIDYLSCQQEQKSIGIFIDVPLCFRDVSGYVGNMYIYIFHLIFQFVSNDYLLSLSN